MFNLIKHHEDRFSPDAAQLILRLTLCFNKYSKLYWCWSEYMYIKCISKSLHYSILYTVKSDSVKFLEILIFEPAGKHGIFKGYNKEWFKWSFSLFLKIIFCFVAATCDLVYYEETISLLHCNAVSWASLIT